jgi:hypothetical protein
MMLENSRILIAPRWGLEYQSSFIIGTGLHPVLVIAPRWGSEYQSLFIIGRHIVYSPVEKRRIPIPSPTGTQSLAQGTAL